MRRYEISDEQWALIADLFVKPPGSRRGRPPRCARLQLNAAFWILCSGAAWRDLPERFGPWSTAYSRFNRWRHQGVFDHVLKRLHLQLDAQGLIDLDTWLIDATTIRATRAAAGAPKKGGALA